MTTFRCPLCRATSVALSVPTGAEKPLYWICLPNIAGPQAEIGLLEGGAGVLAVLAEDHAQFFQPADVLGGELAPARIDDAHGREPFGPHHVGAAATDLQAIAREGAAVVGHAHAALLEIVGFWTPQDLIGIDLLGYHLHALSDDRRVGGHVYDLAGDPVKTLFRGSANAGMHEVSWDGKSRRGKAVVQGVYLIVVKIDKDRQVRKVLVVK